MTHCSSRYSLVHAEQASDLLQYFCQVVTVSGNDPRYLRLEAWARSCVHHVAGACTVW